MNLEQIRKELDKIDTKIIELISKRVSYIPKVANFKIKNNIPRFDSKREKEIITKTKKMAKAYNLNPDLAENLMKLLIQESHRIEKEIMKK